MKLGIDFGYSSTKYVKVAEVQDVAKNSIVQKGIITNESSKSNRSNKSNESNTINGGKETIGEVIQKLSDKFPEVTEIYITGGMTKVLDLKSLDDLDKNIQIVNEIDAIGRGGLKILGKVSPDRSIKDLNNLISVSCGTGVAIVQVTRDKSKKIMSKHLGGTGIGGGTLLALSQKLLGTNDLSKIDQLAQQGELSKVDLRIKDIVGDGIGSFGAEITASNLAKIKQVTQVSKQDLQVTKSDLAAGILNLITEAILSHLIIIRNLSENPPNNLENKNKEMPCVLLGRLVQLPYIHRRIKSLSQNFNMEIIIPDLATYGPAIGAVL